MQKLLISTLVLFCYGAALAQTPSNEILLQLKKLKVLGSVLYIAAHPDDENNTLLPYLAKEQLYRTAYLSLTRGDGGQNLIGDEQGIELGLIRTQELIAARKVDGGEQYFSSAYEFGYSKSANETLQIWDKQKVLSDVVWVIRKYKPDIIIARFPPDARAGHGHHAASAIFAKEAFFAAADAKQFPEQLQQPNITVWQAKRLLWNTANFGNNNTTSDTQLKVEVGQYNPLLGKSYGEIGGEARTMHKSQGEGRARRKGSITEYFAHVAGDSTNSDLMQGINTTWSAVAGAEHIANNIEQIIQNFQAQQPQAIVPALVKLAQQMQTLPNAQHYWVQQKIAEVQQLIVQCLGLSLEAIADNEYAVKGSKLGVSFIVNSRQTSQVQLNNISLRAQHALLFDTVYNALLPKNKNVLISKAIPVASSLANTQPYWLNKPMQNGSMFQVTDYAQIGLPETVADYQANFNISVEGYAFNYTLPLQYKVIDPVRGELLQPVVITPAIVVAMQQQVLLTKVQNGQKAAKPIIQAAYKSFITKANAPATILFQQQNKTVYQYTTTLQLEAGKSYNIEVPLEQVYQPALGNQITCAIVLHQVDTFSQALQKISYNHIPNLHYFYSSQLQIVATPVQATKAKIAYINGAGDKVAAAVQQLGMQVTVLEEKDITLQQLQQYNAVITGIRAYNTNEWLTAKNDVLNAYVQQGGNLIIQYLRSNTIGNTKIKAGPYPFTISPALRVTEENAAVQFVLPKHAVLNYPNKITPADFEHWVQERSTYQAEILDPHFETPLSMSDTHEQPSKGSLAIAAYGKGNVAYVSLVLFRQLPAAVPGAYKLLANLIALPQHQ